MRWMAVFAAAAILSIPVAAPVVAGSSQELRAAPFTDISAAKKKAKKKPKVEYMKAVPVK